MRSSFFPQLFILCPSFSKAAVGPQVVVHRDRSGLGEPRYHLVGVFEKGGLGVKLLSGATRADFWAFCCCYKGALGGVLACVEGDRGPSFKTPEFRRGEKTRLNPFPGYQITCRKSLVSPFPTLRRVAHVHVHAGAGPGNVLHKSGGGNCAKSTGTREISWEDFRGCQKYFRHPSNQRYQVTRWRRKKGNFQPPHAARSRPSSCTCARRAGSPPPRSTRPAAGSSGSPCGSARSWRSRRAPPRRRRRGGATRCR